MGFEEIIGQDLIRQSLARTLQQGQVAHAYLFSGPAGSGKKTMAHLFIQALNCQDQGNPPCKQCLPCRKTASGNHPGLTSLLPQGSYLKIEQVREIQESLHYRVGEGNWKVCLLHEADRLTLPAANSLLKILEEPPADLVFVLLSSRPWALLPTIVSRCAHFSLKPLPDGQIRQLLQGRFSLSAREEEVIVEMAGGNPGRAVELADQGGWEEKYTRIQQLVQEVEKDSSLQLFARAEEVSKQEDLEETLDLLFLFYRENWLRSLSAAGQGSYFLERICRAVLQTKDELSSNVNRRLALEALFLKMRGVV